MTAKPRLVSKGAEPWLAGQHANVDYEVEVDNMLDVVVVQTRAVVLHFRRNDSI